MPDVPDHLGWGAAVVVVPVVAVTLCVVVVALAALAARQPGTRRHTLAVIKVLTEYVATLRRTL